MQNIYFFPIYSLGAYLFTLDKRGSLELFCVHALPLEICTHK